MKRKGAGCMKTFVDRIPVNSLRIKLPAIIIVIVLPLVFLLIYFSQNAIDVVHDQVAKSNKNLLAMYMKQLDDSLAKVDKYLAVTGATNYDIVKLGSSVDDDYSMAKVNLVNRLNTDMKLYPLIDSFFVYVPARDDYFYTFQEGVGTLKERDRIQSYITDRIHAGPKAGPRFSRNGWEAGNVDGDFYLFRVYDYGNVMLGAWVNVARLKLPMELINFGELGTSFYVDRNGFPLEPESRRAVRQIDVTNGDEYYKVTDDEEERFLVITERSKVGEFSLVALVQEKSILENLRILRRVAMIISIASLFTFPLALFLVRKTVLLPLGRILSALRFTRDGFMDYRIENVRTSDEFQKVNEAFNQMVSQIHKLKIDVYEEQLAKQRAELKMLQLQLNPHFLLNALNIMHSLAFMKRTELIQELCIILTQYFRYMLESRVPFVPLKDELQHVRNYLRVQELRFQDQLTYEIRCPAECMNVEVPPLLVHTFVENIIKHAVTMEEPTRAAIDICRDRETGAGLTIRITDNGPGFPEPVLRTIRRGEQIIDENGVHVGIWNVQRRLELLYEGKAKIGFSNLAKGASVEIRIPLFGKMHYTDVAVVNH